MSGGRKQGARDLDATRRDVVVVVVEEKEGGREVEPWKVVVVTVLVVGEVSVMSCVSVY